ncbi:MAG: hypothetical protein MUF01_00050 [Bryobacterales bacterium]|jgi:hypothetical protein|nr:hypothetical protein [Bryobacterales bacterium]
MEHSGPDRARRDQPQEVNPSGGVAHVPAYRHRVILVADSTGSHWISSVAPIPRNTAQRIQRVAVQATMARFVWADSRLTEPGHPLSYLLPTSVPPRGLSALCAPEPGTQPPTPQRRWRRLLPWVAAVATAGLGYLVLLVRAA